MWTKSRTSAYYFIEPVPLCVLGRYAGKVQWCIRCGMGFGCREVRVIYVLLCGELTISKFENKCHVRNLRDRVGSSPGIWKSQGSTKEKVRETQLRVVDPTSAVPVTLPKLAPVVTITLDVPSCSQYSLRRLLTTTTLTGRGRKRCPPRAHNNV